MLAWTEGQIHHSGYRLEMSYNPDELLLGEDAGQCGYRLILVMDGVGIMQVGDLAYPIAAPGVYCFNHLDQVLIHSETRIQANGLCFHPGVLNERLGRLLSDASHDPNDPNDPPDPGDAHTTAITDVQDMWILEPFYERSDRYYGGMPLDPSVARHAYELLEEIGHNLRVQPDCYWPCRSRSTLMELLFLIRRVYQRTAFVPDTIPHAVPESVKPVLEYLHTHYKQKIKLEDLTARFHVNKTTLNEQFKRSTGLSLIAYLNKIRMQMADSMLRNTTLPTKEIIERIGIGDEAHFLRNFRKYSGYSPAEFRSAYCWMLNKNG